mmetsp:Transcript_33434/g.56144  ORF Transcript_33434/g.56144 Transcript_33434/m.56144 type:complete len:201 (+) Transcript_33434:177-779(+)
MRRLPPPISTPFHTMSYACARAVLRSLTSSGCGAVKGWCRASSRSSSALYSNIGKSVTQSKLCDPSGTICRLLATNWRTRSSVLLTSASSPAAMSRRSSGPAPMRSISASPWASLSPPTRALAPSRVFPSAATRANAIPFDPALVASLAMSPLGLMRALEMRLPSGTQMALTTPPSATAALNTTNPQSATMSDTVRSCSP